MASSVSTRSWETGVTDYEPVTHRRPVRRRRSWVTLLAVLLVIATILVVGDRVAAQVASRQLKAQVAQELAARDVAYSSLDVGVNGVPFLTQVAAGHYDEITIDMSDVQLPAGTGRSATLPALHVVATGVDADTAQVLQGNATVVAEQVTGTAVVSYRTLQDLLDLSAFSLKDITFSDEGGALKVQGHASVAGLSIPLAAVAEVTVDQGTIVVKLRDAKAVGIEAPQIAKNYLDDLVNQSITAKLPQLPFGLTLDRLEIAPDGLAITATGHQVPLLNS